MDAFKRRTLSGNIVTTFLFLILLTMIISLIGNVMGWQSSYIRINPITGDIDKTVVTISNLFSINELRNIVGNVMTNFVTFAPLGSFLIAFIGIGIAYKSGFLTVINTILGRFISKFWMTFIFVILGIMSNVFGDVGYVLLIPLGALFYLANNRNPIVAIVAIFVAVASGNGINFLFSNLDIGLITYTELAAKLTDAEINISNNGNLFFNIIGSISLAFLITYITEKVIIPNIPKYKVEEEIIEEISIGRKEKRGLVLASIGTILLLIIFIMMIIPSQVSNTVLDNANNQVNYQFMGMLLDNTGDTYAEKLFGLDSYFLSSIVYLLSFILIIAGWLYGLGAKTLRTKEQFSQAIYDSLNNVGVILVLMFFASQFIAIFKSSNIGLYISSVLINIIEDFDFASFPLLLIVFIMYVISSIFFTSTITKWAFISPVIIPMFMNANMTPEFAQAVFRVSESVTNVITPLFAYFIIFIGYLEIYNKGENRISFRDCYRLLWPYSLSILLLWIVLIIIWYIIGLPIGIGVSSTV